MEDFDFVIPKIDPALTDAVRTKRLDVPYAANSPSQTMDVYFPEDPPHTPAPVIAYFHGGAFMKGSKNDDSLEPMLRAVPAGYVVASVNYRLSGEARFPAMLYDAKAALRFLRSMEKEWNLDPRRIAVWGPSSGGWLVSMLAATNGNPAFENLSMGCAEFSSDADAVIDWCGPAADFLKMDPALAASGAGPADHNEAISPESRFLGCKITEIPELCRLAAPVTHVTADTPPFCIFHGERDQVVPCEQSLALAEAIRAAAGEDRVELHIEKGKPHHGHPWYHEKWVSDACIRFLNRVFYGK